MPLKTVFAILSAQEGVLNSSSNNSKFKNIDELKARMAAKSGGAGGFGGGVSSGGGFGGGFGSKLPKRQQQQVIIEEIDDAPKQQRLFDYNLNQVDKSLLPPNRSRHHPHRRRRHPRLARFWRLHRFVLAIRLRTTRRSQPPHRRRTKNRAHH